MRYSLGYADSSFGHPFSPRTSRANSLADQPQVREALDWLDRNLDWTTAQQIRLTEIPAPSFQEEKRAQAVKEILSAEGLSVFTDKIGNVIGELRGTQDKEVVLLTAHLDTVFPRGHRNQCRLAKAIACSLPESPTTARGSPACWPWRAPSTLRKSSRSALFCLPPTSAKRAKAIFAACAPSIDAYRSKIRAVIVLDGSGIDHVTTKALASRRVEVVITGPGGHSWSDFGMPNPINALVRGSVRFINTKVPTAPRTTFNLGQIEGGTSVNSIPYEAKLKVDLRSENEDEIVRMETALRECIAAGVKDEMDNSRDRMIAENPEGIRLASNEEVTSVWEASRMPAPTKPLPINSTMRPRLA